jgi:hypothetical protein
MAKGFKTGGKDWEPGQSGNPLGRRPLPAAYKKIQKLSPHYVRMVISRLARMTKDELYEFLQSSDGSSGPNMLEMMIGAIAVKAAADGDHSKLNFLLDRTIGKVVEEKRLQIQPVTYKTSISADGSLVQEVIEAEILDDEGGEGRGDQETEGSEQADPVREGTD